ncbi:RagB/SusD family nutrient uptake outer membrane protein [Arcticibacterium luteifluviistationis]|uniref:RagB/SusD family nutrient uptake outer membrane protein n=1 Tax=Arcticibacterium luteifluviistationis TaxID=1784714 RepID=A0A2Z4GHI4_9BACT|nr:RagB/SusD family nutrient uptake outer membrane protein [Arcticibacterium luteifluviistationis]AWW00475.1 RagB/SusD family nutrient uptake outer membrane protein [Arcticibacterium luteifluviistationis]
MKKILNILFAGLMLSALNSCNDLDTTPYVGEVSDLVYQDADNYKKVLAKLYAGLAVSGIEPQDGNVDLKGIDGGSQSYLRAYWYLQEFTTDEAVVGWGDPGLPDLHASSWTASNQWTSNFYSRALYQVTVANEFIRESSPEKLEARGLAGNTQIPLYRSEAKFLRALSYYHALDMFGSVPFVTEADPVGAFLPEQISRADLFTYLETELKALENELPGPQANEYGRADQGAVWMTLAKLYLNAEVYTGTPKYNEAAEYAKKVIDAGYTLSPNYQANFMADNDQSNELIFTINYDGNQTATWGGTTTLIHAQIGGTMNPADFGVDGGWSGFRTTPEFVALFDNGTDGRRLLHSDGQKLEIDEIGTFDNGYAVAKWSNLTSAGVAGKSLAHTDTDFGVYRLSDAYLMYAEAVTRGGSGDQALALSLVNQLRTRANAAPVTALSLDFLLDERGRELFWEAHRRTDLIRFGKFTTGYNWAWKGNIKEGRDIGTHMSLFPIASSDIVANTNLVQNSGY